MTKSKSTHGGKRKGAGRTQEFYAKRYAVRLTTDQAETAKQLGDGDVSAGIRAALDWAAENKSQIPKNSS